MQDIILEDNRSALSTNDESIIKQETDSDPLSLQEHEEIIQRALNSFVDAGISLKAIKVKKLYKSVSSSFEEYCKRKWGFSDQYAYNLIKAATTMEEMRRDPTIVGGLPQSEGQVRALLKSKNPADDWTEAQIITEKDQPTAKEIEAFIKEKNKEDIIDVEIDGEDANKATEEAVNNTSDLASILSLLKDIVRTPYEKGERTGRVQISVDADNESAARLKRLREQLDSPNYSVVAHALIFMEESLKSIPDTSSQSR